MSRRDHAAHPDRSSAAALHEVRVPLPRGFARRLPGIVLLAVVIIVYPLALVAASCWFGPFAAVAVVLAGPFVALGIERFDRRFDRRTAVLRREVDRVVGFGRGVSLPPGVGTVMLVERGAWHLRRGRTVYDVTHGARRGPLATFDRLIDARTFAERLCRLGRYDYGWTSPGARDAAVRPLGDLDRPLVERLRERPELFGELSSRGAAALESAHRVRPDGSLWLRSAARFPAARLVGGAVIALAALVGGVAANDGAIIRRHGAHDLGGLGVAIGLSLLGGVVIKLLADALHEDLVVSRRSIRARWTLLGLGFGGWTLRADEVEELYVTARPSLGLVGDDVVREFALPHRADADGVRILIARALAGASIPSVPAASTW